MDLDAALAELAVTPVAADAPLSVHRLDNGLTVYVLEDHRAPVVAHSLWYRAGSIDETSGVTGVAHVLEHMMFNGTNRYGPGEYDKQMQALGAYANALTWTDYTAYTVEAPARHLGAIMSLEAERMSRLAIDDAEFAREIRVIMEERRQSTDDDPSGLLFEQLYAAAFHASPQRWPIIGWMSDLESMTADDARAWYRQWYRPDNAVLVIAGDVAPDQVLALARDHYGDIPSDTGAPLPTRRAQHEPEQGGTRRVTVRAYVPTPQLALGFKAPRLHRAQPGGTPAQAALDEDVFALAILAELLDWGRVLETALVRKRRLADEAWASFDYLMRAPGLFTIGAVCAADVSPARVERALCDAVAAVARDGIDEASLRRVRMQMMASRLYRADSVFEQAEEVGRLAMLGFGDDARVIDARLAAVTTAQVQSVARRYFRPETMTVALLVPANEDTGDEPDEHVEVVAPTHAGGATQHAGAAAAAQCDGDATDGAASPIRQSGQARARTGGRMSG
ncbi:M16 family metallopeptidase [Robbsia andropogonis]|uniref:M16 family metallopeptidase n=1 Tax=Robbsia andropogonis TaxID=28092 RepID=UPI003D2179CD